MPGWDTFKWDPTWGTRVRVVDLATGDEKTYTVDENLLALHTINAFEDLQRNVLVMDVVAFVGLGCDVVLRGWYINQMLNFTGGKAPSMGILNRTQALRIEVPLDSPGRDREPLCQVGGELGVKN